MQLIWLEALGTFFGILQVILARQNSIHNYLFGILAIVIGMWVLYQSALYADILLNLYYLAMSIYGWFYWRFGDKKHEAQISYSTSVEHIKAIVIVIGCFILMNYWLTSHTDSDVPIWDASVSAFAWAGMWLMARRKMENWVYLNISNILAIPLLAYKELYIYAALTIFLFGMGVSGYFKWQKLIKYDHQ